MCLESIDKVNKKTLFIGNEEEALDLYEALQREIESIGYKDNGRKFELCKTIVESGNSKVFKNWREFSGISKKIF